MALLLEWWLTASSPYLVERRRDVAKCYREGSSRAMSGNRVRKLQEVQGKSIGF